jgi:hypothetical protein
VRFDAISRPQMRSKDVLDIKTECSRKVGMRFIECGAAGWSPNTDQEPDSWFAC